MYIFTLLIPGSRHSHSPVSLQHGIWIQLHCMMEKVQVCHLMSLHGMASSQMEGGKAGMAEMQREDASQPVNVPADTHMVQAMEAVCVSVHAEICRCVLTNTPVPAPPFATPGLSLNKCQTALSKVSLAHFSRVSAVRAVVLK